MTEGGPSPDPRDPHAVAAADAGAASPPAIGLTGAIGSGKSTVARLLARRGAAVIDADALARRATEEPETIAAIAAAFGKGVLRGDGLDRGALAARVFGDEGARARLEAIVHPRVAALRREAAAAARAREPRPPLVVHDVPLLFEAGLEREMDLVVVVDAPLATRVRRVAARSGLSEEEIRRRDAAQLPAEEKRARADVVVDNGGDEAELERRLDALWPTLLAASGRRTGRGGATGG